MKINVDKATAFDLLDNANLIRIEPWRHGRREVYVVQHDGKHWMTSIDVAPEEGWQVYGTVEFIEVQPVEKTVTDWVPV